MHGLAEWLFLRNPSALEDWSDFLYISPIRTSEGIACCLPKAEGWLLGDENHIIFCCYFSL